MAKKKEFDLDEVERLAGLGLTEEQIGLALGVSRATVQRNRAEDEAFEAAYKKGKGQGVAHVTNKLRELIDNGNPTSILFFLKCKGNFNEQAEIERRIEELEHRLLERKS